MLEWGKMAGGSQSFTFPHPFSVTPYFLSVMMIAAPTSSVVIDEYIIPGTLTSTGTKIGLKWLSTGQFGSDVTEEWLWSAIGKA